MRADDKTARVAELERNLLQAAKGKRLEVPVERIKKIGLVASLRESIRHQTPHPSA